MSGGPADAQRPASEPRRDERRANAAGSVAPRVAAGVNADAMDFPSRVAENPIGLFIMG